MEYQPQPCPQRRPKRNAECQIAECGSQSRTDGQADANSDGQTSSAAIRLALRFVTWVRHNCFSLRPLRTRPLPLGTRLGDEFAASLGCQRNTGLGNRSGDQRLYVRMLQPAG